MGIKATRTNNSIGVYINAADRKLLESKASAAGLSLNKYIGGLIQKDLKEEHPTLEQLQKENQRLRYEGCFNQVAYEFGNTKIVSVDETPIKLKKVQLV